MILIIAEKKCILSMNVCTDVFAIMIAEIDQGTDIIGNASGTTTCSSEKVLEVVSKLC